MWSEGYMDVIRKVKQGGQNGIRNLTGEVESTITTAIGELFPEKWESAAVDSVILARLSTIFSGRSIHLPGGRITSNWKIYQSRGIQDKVFASMAFIYNIAYHDGLETSGVAFFDSHCRDLDRNTFNSIKKDSVRRIHSNAPHGQILLYDYELISGMAFPVYPEYMVGNSPVNWNAWLPVSSAAAVQTELAMSIGSKSTALYRTSLPFAYQLCHRHLYGLDLDHNKPAMDIAKGIRDDRGHVNYLVAVSLAWGNARPRPHEDISLDVYSELK
jgi:hypothetical protein